MDTMLIRKVFGDQKGKVTLLGVREDLLDEIFGLYWLIKNITRKAGFEESSWTFRND